MIDLTLEQILGRTVYHYQLHLPIKEKKCCLSKYKNYC